MRIEIQNCNNIKHGIITLAASKLNIKYGVNGTGKSTLSRALCLHSSNQSLEKLRPFNARIQSEITPQVSVDVQLTSVMVFDDTYVNQFAFKPDEVLANSFEIFIKNAEYEERERAINEMIKIIKSTFSENQSLNNALNDFQQLLECFGNSKSGYSKNGALHKALGNGNFLLNLPDKLKPFESFLNLGEGNNVKWIKWQIDGLKFSQNSEECPYCVGHISSKKDMINAVKDECNAKEIEHLNNILSILDRLDGYFSASTRNRLRQIASNHQGLSDDEWSYLVEVKDQIHRMCIKLAALKNISFFSLKEAENSAKLIADHKIDLQLLAHLDATQTQEMADVVNNSLDEILSNTGLLVGAINKHKAKIGETIQSHQTKINDFLHYAGYHYRVSVKETNDTYKMNLLPNDEATQIDSSKHLSYGEKNAFALVLFMYDALSKNPSLIILDDPVSSFDEHKKFAIFQMLFLRHGGLKEKTTLLLTHDLEPLIDMVCTFRRDIPSNASFLHNNEGLLIETPITKDDIQTFHEICNKNIEYANNTLIKLIYLRRRYEILGDKNLAYQCLSSLFKGSEKPYKKTYNGDILFTEQEQEAAEEEIKKHISTFNYIDTHLEIKNERKLCNTYRSLASGYEKLQIYRIIFGKKNDIKGLNEDNNVIRKFINETYHIENEYVMQLDPVKFNTIPIYIIKECDKRVNSLMEDDQR